MFDRFFVLFFLTSCCLLEMICAKFYFGLIALVTGEVNLPIRGRHTVIPTANAGNTSSPGPSRLRLIDMYHERLMMGGNGF